MGLKGSQLSVWMPEEELRKLREFAEKTKLPLGAIVKAAVKYAFEKEEFLSLFDTPIGQYIGRAKREDFWRKGERCYEK